MAHLPELMSQMGKVLVSPHANATNKCKKKTSILCLEYVLEYSMF